jgi:hypothetical protein
MKQRIRRNNRRGAAVVEMVISLFVILPLAFYMVFLQDLILYKLNNQEASVSGVWDFQVGSYQEASTRSSLDKVIEGVSKQHRRMFFDHTSAYNSYDGAFEAGLNDAKGDGQMGHHVAQGAHECWVAEGAELPHCYTDFFDDTNGTQDGSGLPTLGKAFYDAHNRGGMVVCDARLGVFNKFLPQKLFSQWSNAELMSKATNKDDSGKLEQLHGQDLDGLPAETHKSDKSGAVSAGDQFLFPYVTAGVLVDTWALNYDKDDGASEYLKDRGPNENAPPMADKNIAGAPGFSHFPVSSTAALTGAKLHPFLDRVTTIYKQDSVSEKLTDAKEWHDDMTDFLSFTSTTDGHGDLLSSPPLHFKWGDKTRQNEGNEYSSGWADSKAQYERQSGYMGETSN